MGGVGEASRHRGFSLGNRPTILRSQLGERAIELFPSSSLWLVGVERTTDRGFSVGTSSMREVRPYNNGLHQTGRVGAAASRPVVEARPAGEPEC